MKGSVMNNRRIIYQFGYRRCADQDRSSPARHPVIVVGAGPVGLCTAIDLAQRGLLLLRVAPPVGRVRHQLLRRRLAVADDPVPPRGGHVAPCIAVRAE